MRSVLLSLFYVYPSNHCDMRLYGAQLCSCQLSLLSTQQKGEHSQTSIYLQKGVISLMTGIRAGTALTITILNQSA